MALAVEVTGVGVCRNPSSTMSTYSVFIVSVQQEAYQGWTIYRRYQSFLALHEHLQVSLYSTGVMVPQLPQCDPNNFQIQYLESCALSVDVWLKTVASNPMILRTQFMYQFLCMDANLPPPYLDVCWRRGNSSSNQYGDARNSNYDIMDDMDDIFDKHTSDDVSMDDTSSASSNQSSRFGVASGGEENRGVWNFMQSNTGLPPAGKSHHSSNSNSGNNNNHHNNTSGNKRGFEDDDDEDDGLDIQSLSVVEAEFLYDKSIDGKLTLNKLTGQPEQQQGQLNQQQNQQSRSISPTPVNKAMRTSTNNQSANNLLATALANGGNSSNINPSNNGTQSSSSSSSSSSSTIISPQKPKRKINLDSFHIIKVVGKGSFGKVFLVREKSTNTIYALKVLKKEYIIRKNQVEHTLTERSILGYIHHPFIVGLNMAFQTADKLFFVLDYCSGGELFFHLGKIGRFTEERAKFYAAQIILALEYVHSLDIIYRDLKPENVLLDATGNVRLTDFGLSKEGVSNHSTGAFSFCGTPEYIAPEVLLRQGHGRAVDWWSLGALLYEMIAGLPPFYSRNRETMFEKIMKADLAFPPFMSETAKDILSKLLVRDPKLRFGSGERDAAEVKEHPFFSDIDWDGLYHGRIAAPWTPAVVGSLDTSQFDHEFTSMNPAVSPEVRGAYFGSVDRTFEGFSFVDEAAANLMSQHVASSASSYKSGVGFSMLSSTINANKKHY